MGKPLTRSEYNEAKLRGRSIHAFADRIEATIEAGGFAPEPLSERALLSWLWADKDVPNELLVTRDFTFHDLGRAWSTVRAFGVVAHLHPHENGGYLVLADGIEYEAADIAACARILTALAYQNGNPARAISHLLTRGAP
jgi:hypothetical protein